MIVSNETPEIARGRQRLAQAQHTVIAAAMVGACLLAGAVTAAPADAPFQYDISALKAVPAELISHRETAALTLIFTQAVALAVYDSDTLAVVGDTRIALLDRATGVERRAAMLDGAPVGLAVSGERLYVLFSDRIAVLDPRLARESVWRPPHAAPRLLSIAAQPEMVFVTDATERQVLRYTPDGQLAGRYDERGGPRSPKGFILRSLNFDVAAAPDGAFWVVNSGMHTLLNVTADGVFRASFRKVAMAADGFCGCCNPTRIAVFSDGRLVTVEKSLIRVKVLDREGRLQGVVAAPASFDDDTQLDVAVDADDHVLVLDSRRRMIRVFEAVAGWKGLP